MVAHLHRSRGKSTERGAGRSTSFLLAFVIGALVGIGLGVTWIPERRRRRLTASVGERYQRLRDASGAALGDMRRAGRDMVGDFREELGSSLEAAREEFADMTRQQVRQVRKALERERKRLSR